MIDALHKRIQLLLEFIRKVYIAKDKIFNNFKFIVTKNPSFLIQNQDSQAHEYIHD